MMLHRWRATASLLLMGVGALAGCATDGPQTRTAQAATARDQIAYTAARGGRAHLALLDVGSRSRRRITSGGIFQADPSWSPDGRRLAYVDTRGQSQPRIAVADAATGRTHVLTGAGVFEEDPSWSPDGLRIAFARTVIPAGTATAYSEIWVMRPSGRGARRLTRNAVADARPAWSRDSRRIVFTRWRSTRSDVRDVWVMRADGTGQRRLVRDATGAVWSPDGRQLAYGRLTGRIQGCCAITDLYVADLAGRHPRLLARRAGAPAWSPDGTRLAFQRQADGRRSHLWVVNAAGGGIGPLTTGSGSESAPAWRP